MSAWDEYFAALTSAHRRAGLPSYRRIRDRTAPRISHDTVGRVIRGAYPTRGHGTFPVGSAAHIAAVGEVVGLQLVTGERVFGVVAEVGPSGELRIVPGLP